MTRSTTARHFLAFEDGEDRFLPEGPRLVTLHDREALAWVNIQTAADSRRGAVHMRFWDDGEQGLWNLAGRPGFLLPTSRPGVLLIGMEKQIGTLDLETNHFEPLATIPDDHPRTIINDGEVLPGGEAIVFGTKDTKFQEAIGYLYLFTLADSKITVLAAGQTCSNGKFFARDDQGLLLFDIDTPTKTVTRYRLDLQARQALADGVALDLRSHDAFPDGMCYAGNSTAIVAFYNPARVPQGRAIRFDLRSGLAIEEWITPGAPRVTCPLLVRRPDGVKLILTTATEGMPAEDFQAATESGNLFIADTDLTEVPAAEAVTWPSS